MKTAKKKMLAPVFVRRRGKQYFDKDWRNIFSTKRMRQAKKSKLIAVYQNRANRFNAIVNQPSQFCLSTARSPSVGGIGCVKRRGAPEKQGAARMAFTDMEIAEAHASVRSFAQPEDMYKLGLIYATGQGGEIDLVHAHQWFNLAASRGFEAAKEARRELADMMSTAQIAEAQKLAREWLKSHKAVERVVAPMPMAMAA